MHTPDPATVGVTTAIWVAHHALPLKALSSSALGSSGAPIPAHEVHPPAGCQTHMMGHGTRLWVCWSRCLTAAGQLRSRAQPRGLVRHWLSPLPRIPPGVLHTRPTHVMRTHTLVRARRVVCDTCSSDTRCTVHQSMPAMRVSRRNPRALRSLCCRARAHAAPLPGTQHPPVGGDVADRTCSGARARAAARHSVAEGVAGGLLKERK